MTPFFDRLDLAPDAAFLLWVAGGMVAIGLVIGAYMAGRGVWRWAALVRGYYWPSRRAGYSRMVAFGNAVVLAHKARRHVRFERRVTRVTRRRQ